MPLGLGQQQKTKLAHVLGQEQLLGLKLLAKSLPELRAEVYAELERNPVIDSIENPLETPLSEIEHHDRELDAPISDYPEEDTYSPVTGRSDDEEYAERRQAFFDNQVSVETLQQHLTQQLPISTIAPADHPLAEVLIGDLDANGYYKGSLPDVAMAFQKTLPEIESVLAQIREFDPPGCGARTLAECYVAQLDVITDAKLRERLRQLLTNNPDELLTVCAAEPTLVEALKQMNGTPGRAFLNEKDRAEYVNPEITAVKRRGRWVPQLDERSIPEFRFSKSYLRILNDPKAAETTKNFVREKLAAAKSLQAAIANRESTISLIATEIFEQQQPFFEQGFAALRPMTETAIAQKLGIEPSTVSRTVNDKYVATPKGTIELRRFFTTKVKNAAGEEISQDALLKTLQSIVDHEDKCSPLSDSSLVLAMEQAGYPVARRTIAKYRDKLNLPTAAQRKIK